MIKMNINKYGYLRLNYLKEYKKGLYESLLMKGKLEEHLFSVSIDSEKQFKILMNNFIKNDARLSEKNKEVNQMEWVKLMNNYKNCSEEIILKEIVYK